MSSSRSRSRHERQLVCGGQDSVDADGNPQHPGDMAAQIELSLDNLEAVPAAAEMTLADVVRLNVYTTDVDELFEQWGRLAERLGNAGCRFATTVLDATRLAAPQLLVLLEATADRLIPGVRSPQAGPAAGTALVRSPPVSVRRIGEDGLNPLNVQ